MNPYIIPKLSLLFSVLFLSLSLSLKANPGNKIYIAVPSTGLPVDMHICEIDTFIVGLTNLDPTNPVSGVEFDVLFPVGVEYVSNTNGFSTVSTGPNMVRLNVGTIAVGTTITLTILVRSDCAFYSFVNGGGTARNRYRAYYTAPTNDYDELRIVGNPNGYTNSYSPLLPALSIINVAPLSPSVTFGSLVTRTITVTNAGDGHISTFDFKDTHGTGYVIDSIKGGTLISNTSTECLIRVSAADIAANATNDDGDGLFERSERYDVTIYLRVADCSTSVSSNLSVSFGCSVGNYCATSTSNAGLSFGAIIPNISVSTSESSNIRCLGANVTKVVRLVNNGNALSKQGSIKLNGTWGSNGTEYNYSWLLMSADTSTIEIRKNSGAWVRAHPDSVWNTQSYDTGYNNKYIGCFGPLNQSVQAFRVLIPDMNPNDTIRVRWQFKTCCNTTACYGVDYTNNFNYTLKYKDPCLIYNYVSRGESGGSWYPPVINTVATFPTDISVPDTANIYYDIVSYNGNTFGSYAPNSIIRMEWALPSNLTPVLPLIPADFRVPNPANATQFWTPTSVTYVGNILQVNFPYPFPFGINGSQFKIRLVPNCSSGSVLSSILFKNQFSADITCSSNCLNNMPNSCSAGPLSIQVHCPVPCPLGLENQSFKLKRTNLGLPDNLNNNSANGTAFVMSNVRTDRVMLGDTLEGTFKGIVRTNGVITNFGYIYARLKMHNSSLIPAGADVRIWDASTAQYYNFTNLPLTQSGANYLVLLSPAVLTANNPAYTETSFQNGDSIIVKSRVRNFENPGNTIVNRQVNTDFYATVTLNGTTYSCDNWSGNFQQVGYSYENYIDKSNTVVSGCTNSWVRNVAGIRIGGEWSFDAFPYEYRNFVVPGGSLIILPAGYTPNLATSYLEYYRMTNGVGISTNIPLNPASVTQSGDTLRIDMRSYFVGYGGALPLADAGILMRPIINMLPSCGTPTSIAVVTKGRGWHYNLSSALNQYEIANNYVDVPTNKSYYPYGMPSYPITGPSTWYYSPGTVTFQGPSYYLNASVPTADAYNNRVTWSVQITNLSVNSAASNAFLYFDELPGGIDILQVKEGATTITPTVNGIYQLGTLNIASQRTFTVTATYSSCNIDSILVKSGWNCSAYPTTMSAYSCTPGSLYLKIEPEPGSMQISVNSQDTPPFSLCQQVNYEFRVRGVDLGNIYQLYNKIIMSAGYEIVPGSTQVKYPATTGTYVAIPNPTKVGNEYTYNISSSVAAIGARGLKNLLDTDSSQYLIKFKVQTFCPGAPDQFVAGRKVFFQSYGKTWCGSETNKPIVATQPYNVVGAPTPYVGILSLENIIPMRACTPTGTTYHVRFQNIGNPPLGPNNPTPSGDSLTVILPKSVVYVAGSSVGIQNMSNIEPHVKVNASGQYELTWPITAGIAYLGVMKFDFNIKGTTDVVCQNSLIQLESSTNGTVVCAGSGSPCNAKIVTGQGEEYIDIVKPVLSISNLKASGTPSGSGTEAVTFTIDVNNTGDAVNLGNLINVNFYADINNNGIYDYTTDAYIGTKAINSLGSPQTQTFSTTLTVPATQTCYYLAVLDTTMVTDRTCACGRSETLSVGVPRLINAGPDVVTCSNIPTTVGAVSMTGYSYTWASPTGLSSSTVAMPTVTLSNTGMANTTTTYIVTTTRTGGCVSKDTVAVTVHPNPTPAFTMSNSCLGTLIQFSDATIAPVSPIATWSWNFGDPSTTSDVSTLQNPVYNYGISSIFNVGLTVTDGNGCTNNATVAKTIYPYPTVNSTVNVNPQCPLPFDDGSITVVASTLYGTLEYSINNGTTWQSSSVFSGLSAGSYIVAVREVSGLCKSLYPGNPVILTNPSCPEICNDGLDNDSDGTIDCADADCSFLGANAGVPPTVSASSAAACAPASVTLTASPNNLITYSYAWTGTTPTNVGFVAASATGTYVVTITRNSSGCTATASAAVTINTPPTISNVSVTQASCPLPINDGSISVTATTTGGPLAYSVNNGATWQLSNTFSNLPDGTYIVLVRNATTLCSTSASGNPYILTSPSGCPNFTPTIEMDNLSFPTSLYSRDFVINISELAYSPSSNPLVLKIPIISGFDFSFSPTTTNSNVFGGSTVNNNLWTFSQNAAFMTVTLKPGVVLSPYSIYSIGLTVTRKINVPGQTNQPITVTVANGTGGDNNDLDNTYNVVIKAQ